MQVTDEVKNFNFLGFPRRRGIGQLSNPYYSTPKKSTRKYSSSEKGQKMFFRGQSFLVKNFSEVEHERLNPNYS